MIAKMNTKQIISRVATFTPWISSYGPLLARRVMEQKRSVLLDIHMHCANSGNELRCPVGSIPHMLDGFGVRPPLFLELWPIADRYLDLHADIAMSHFIITDSFLASYPIQSVMALASKFNINVERHISIALNIPLAVAVESRLEVLLGLPQTMKPDDHCPYTVA